MVLIVQNAFIDRFINVLVMPETRLNDFRVEALNGTEFGSSFLEISPDPFTSLVYFFQDDGHDLRSFLAKERAVRKYW